MGEAEDSEFEVLEERDTFFHRAWQRVGRILRWVFRPNQVGKPIVLSQRGVRLLVLLVAGNLAILILLAAALYRAVSAPLTSETPLSIVITQNVVPSPSLDLTPTPVSDNGAIAFTLRRNGNSDIYAINQSDRQLIRLTYDPAEDRQPTWSPDGAYLAFASNRAHNWDIYLLDLASGALIRLTHNPEFDANPVWSPDGKSLAFESYRRGNLDVYIMSTTGQQLRRVTSDPAPDYAPTWSPDSRSIAFTSFRNNTKDIYVQVLDDKNPTDITQSPDVDEDEAVFSPDGTHLAYVSGSHGNPSIQVTTFDWASFAADQDQTEVFGSGDSPIWSPDGQSLVYTYQRGQRSYLVAANMQGWALFQEVYNTDGIVQDLSWTHVAISQRAIARAKADEPVSSVPFYVELARPTPASGPPYRMVALPNVSSGDSSENQLCDRVNESFNALRKRVLEEAGWDYLGVLKSSWEPITYTPPTGHSRMNWHLCGRAIALDQEPYEEDDPRIELVRDDLGNVVYWRVLIRAARQDGTMGEPLREAPWDLNARDQGGAAMVSGGAYRNQVPSGYYIDFTTLASDYGWNRVPAMWRWRYFWPDIRWWEFQNTDDISWWRCMLDVYEQQQIENAFGPIPGHTD